VDRGCHSVHWCGSVSVCTTKRTTCVRFSVRPFACPAIDFTNGQVRKNQRQAPLYSGEDSGRRLRVWQHIGIPHTYPFSLYVCRRAFGNVETLHSSASNFQRVPCKRAIDEVDQVPFQKPQSAVYRTPREGSLIPRRHVCTQSVRAKCGPPLSFRKQTVKSQVSAAPSAARCATQARPTPEPAAMLSTRGTFGRVMTSRSVMATRGCVAVLCRSGGASHWNRQGTKLPFKPSNTLS
jgi:hypothetical protein